MRVISIIILFFSCFFGCFSIKAQNRDADPVVLKGSAIPCMAGTTPASIVAFKFNGTNWVQIPVQIDEVVIKDIKAPYGPNNCVGPSNLNIDWNLSNNKAYVTDLYANKIWKVDLVTNTISGSIALNGWSEQMTEVFGNVYITNYTNGKVYVLDASTDVLTDSITLVKGASYIQQDANGKLWVLCSGDAALSILPTLNRINPLTNIIEFALTLSGSPSRLSINGTADTLYFLNSGVYQFPIISTSVSASPFITQGTANFYGLGIDPQTSLIYVSDAIDYIQYGKVLIYKPTGTYVKEFDAGIIPGDFWFQ